jgi:hypothetical protein
VNGEPLIVDGRWIPPQHDTGEWMKGRLATAGS